MPARRAAIAGTLLLAIASCQPKPGTDASSMATVKAPSTSSIVQPPVAKRVDHAVESPHGTRNDPYYWLRDDARQDAEMLAYLEAENAYRDHVMAPAEGLKAKLFDEIVGRIAPDDDSVPYHDRGYWYLRRFTTGSEYPIYLRKKGSLDAPEQVVLDANELAEGQDFFSLGNYEVSPNGKLVAYAEDTVGRRQYTLRIKNLETGETYADTIENTNASIAWAADSATIFYVEKDPTTLLGVRVKRHVLGTPSDQDVLVYEETDPSFYMGVGTTGDHAYIVIALGSTVSDEYRVLDAKDPNGKFSVLAPRERDVEYSADHIAGRWVIRTNDEAKNFRLMQVADDEIGDRRRWKELVPEAPGVFIEGFDLFDSHLVIEERSEGLQRIRLRSWATGKDSYVSADESAYSMELDVNAEQGSEWLRYGYTSLTTPWTTYELNFKTGERRKLKQQPVPGYEASGYATERRWATARDGTQVPVSLVYKKGFVRDGTAPLYQYAYGSYGSSMDPSFRSSVVSLLDRGVVFAIAHIRGGQEMGRDWYEQGKLLNKKNTFTDFIDVTEFLVAEKYAAPDKVAAGGGSAGGLLMGAIVNMRPDLYRAIIAAVPFVDVVTTMLDESIPLTTNEFDEWGNPKQKAFYDYMLSYSPYDNVSAQAYPAMLVTTGLWDSQVQYFEPAKWVAKLRATNTGDQPLVFSVNMDAGHGGKSGRFRREEETALEYAFMLTQFGIHE